MFLSATVPGVEASRSHWTDSRLDDLQTEMRAGFARVDADLRGLNGRMDSLQRTMLQIGAGMIIAQTGLIATILGLVITKF